jgi:hypothetical protein
MRTLILFTVILSLAAGAACKRKRHPNPMATIEEESPLANMVSMADAAASSQLLSGFHTLEQGAWRWSMKRFSVSLAVPEPARTRGGRLELKITLPEAIAPPMLGARVTASIGGRKLAAYQVDRTGEQVAAFDVTPELLNAIAVVADFELDKAMPPKEGESRELGLIVTQVSLAAR